MKYNRDNLAFGELLINIILVLMEDGLGDLKKGMDSDTGEWES